MYGMHHNEFDTDSLERPECDDRLYRLIYFSRATALTSAQIGSCFDVILIVAQLKNLMTDVTGALMACDGWFLQMLEGPGDAIDRTYAKICADPRHTDLKLMKRGIAIKRYFEQWTMCGRALAENDKFSVGLMNAAFDPRSFSVQRASCLLRKVAHLQA